ncbi:uncharacterized protein CTRU02_214399 [Colletotrichum truncatum]|uniref:Uncharacterized protein n=1 Tax=Colletotrichum truncatum TaxID=5467 RepID=A0ACC3YEM2_COLTU
MSSLEEDFERPWSGWPNFPALEPVTKKSIDVFTELLKASNEGVPSIVKAFEIINSALTVAEELECKAAGVTAYSTGAHFNGLIPVSSPASVAIAKVHYLTIRFHILDMLHVAFGSHVCLEWFQSQPIESERGCELWQQIEKSLEEDGGNRKKTANSASSNGMPFRAVFCLSWPLLAIAQSSFSSEDLRLAAQERLRYGAKVSGFLGPSDTKE